MLLLVIPSAAAGQEPGVTVDSGPSSKEYAIPLAAARGQTKTKAPKPKATPAPAVTPKTPSRVTTDRSTARSESSVGRKKKTAVSKGGSTGDSSSGRKKVTAKHDAQQPQAAVPTITTPAPRNAGARARVSSSRPPSDDMSAGVVIAGLAVALLALGGLAGLLIRRRRTPIDDY
ncbi:MAG: hypothetical protein M3P44_02820 [Actinomycetota bacterium]|nr:hypothetical protein [Actinomycetota bacterium]